jgi:hypothetical protein
VCEVLSTAGAQLERHEGRSKARLEAAFRQLERMSNATKAYPSRIRFVMKDVLELRVQHWVARRETFTVRGSGCGRRGLGARTGVGWVVGKRGFGMLGQGLCGSGWGAVCSRVELVAGAGLLPFVLQL